uniref:Uncharacterized protein n=1 Tax=Bionectria ochroleuca TaxID=29856 RepID=A0A8H7TR61_BIOOC
MAEKYDLPRGKQAEKPKKFLTIENYTTMQIFHWTGDSYNYIHEGMRIDNTNLLNVQSFTSARRQEVIMADLEWHIAETNGEPEFRVKFTRNFCKGKDKNQPEHPLPERLQSSDGKPPPLFAQPVFHLLGNCISAGAFADYRTVDEVLAVRRPDNQSYGILELDRNIETRPVFPVWTSSGSSLSLDPRIVGALQCPTGVSGQASLLAFNPMMHAERFLLKLLV